MREAGSSYRDIQSATGISVTTLSKRYGNRRKDPIPGGGRAKRSTPSKPGPNDEQLANLFTKIAVAPAIPMGLWAQCDFCASHFVQTGPTAAVKLVELSHDHPALRRLMEGLWKYADEVAWAGILATWLGVPVAHHLAPDFVYRWVQMPLGLPPRGEVTYAPPATTNGHAHQDQPPVTPPTTPFADMDLESVMRMAQGMGIQVDLDAAMTAMAAANNDATTADTANTTDEAAASGNETDTAVTPEAAASDQDSGE